MKNKALYKLGPLFAALTVPLTGAAQNLLEEVTVTAQKREQNLQDVGIAISVFTGDQARALGVQQSFDIAGFTPGVHISGNIAGQNTQFSIRGVTQNDFNDIIEAPNAAYLDEGYLAVAQAQTFAVYDIERLEILKGPQGTLFGRNATGGLVHYISNKPNFDGTEGYIDFQVGEFDTPANAKQMVVEGALGGALTDTVAGRVAFRYKDQDGYLKNLYPDTAFLGPPGPGAGADLGGQEDKSARGTLLFQPDDRTQAMVSLNYSKSELSSGPYQSKPTIGILDQNGELINVIDMPADETRFTIQGDQDGGANAIDGSSFLPGAGIGLPGRLAPGGDFFGYIDPDGEDFTFSGDFAFEDQAFTETWGINVNLQHELSSGVQFTSITDFKDYEKLLFIDVDAAPANQLANYAGVDATSFTQEFRLNGETGRTRWVAGAFYLNIDTTSDNGLKAPVNSIAGSPPFAPVDIGVVADLETNSYSVFGQVDYDLTETLTLTAGARLIQEEKDFDLLIAIFPSFDSFTVNQGDPIPNAFGAGSPYTNTDDSSDTLWTGKLQLDWRYTDDLLLYAGINRGVKAGSFNAPLLGAFLGAGGDESLPYDEEVLVSYEGGFKKSFAGGMTRLNGTAFYYDYTDYQSFLFVGVGGVVQNNDARTYGAELELQTSPMDGLDIMLSGAWFDATVKDVPLRRGSPLPPRDVKPTYAPELQAAGLIRYQWPALGGNLAVQADFSYSDEFFYNLRNFDADKFDSYTIYNSSVSWSSTDSQWQLTLAVRNLTDERAGTQGFDLASLCGCNEIAFREPRLYSVALRYEF